MGTFNPRRWKATDAETAQPFPCDAFAPEGADTLWRGVDVAAPAEILFRWLCQLRAAPYSYDWLDNWGRTSPRRLTPGLERLEIGQTVMSIFELVGFEPGRSLTCRSKEKGGGRGLFGTVWATYRVAPDPAGGCRLLVKLRVDYPRGPWGWLVRRLLPSGDWIMMRRQLLNLKRLAERAAAA